MSCSPPTLLTYLVLTNQAFYGCNNYYTKVKPLYETKHVPHAYSNLVRKSWGTHELEPGRDFGWVFETAGNDVD